MKRFSTINYNMSNLTKKRRNNYKKRLLWFVNEVSSREHINIGAGTTEAEKGHLSCAPAFCSVYVSLGKHIKQ